MIESVECPHEPLRDDQVEDQRQRVHSISLLLYFINFINNRSTRFLKKSLLHFLATSLAGAQQLLNSGAQFYYFDQRFRRKPHHLVAPTRKGLHELERFLHALLRSCFLAVEVGVGHTLAQNIDGGVKFPALAFTHHRAEQIPDISRCLKMI